MLRTMLRIWISCVLSIGLCLSVGCHLKQTVDVPESSAPFDADRVPESQTLPLARSQMVKPGQIHSVALLLPVTGPLALAAKSLKEGFMAAAQQTLGLNRVIKVYDTQPSLNAAYEHALLDQPDLIVGPLSKSDVRVLAQASPQLPVLALNYTPQEETIPMSMVQFGLSPLDEALFLAESLWQEGHTQVYRVISKQPWSRQVAQVFDLRFKALGGAVLGELVYDSGGALDIRVKGASSEWAMRSADAIVLIAKPQPARQLLPLMRFYGIHQPVYANASVYSGRFNAKLDKDLASVYFCDIAHLGIVAERAEDSHPRLYALGFDAYRLINEWPRFKTEQDRLPGMTGLLSMTPSGRIKRRLSWFKFNASGIPVRQSGAMT